VPQFQYRASDAQGRIVEGTLEAPEQRIAVARLQDRGLIPLRVGEGAAGKKSSGIRLSMPKVSGGFRRRLSNKDLLIVTQELSALLQAGLPLDRCLGTLADLADAPELKEILGNVLTEVREGKSLAEAMGMHPRFFPTLYVNMIRAGEIGGFLDTVTQRLSEYLERGQALRDEVKSALTYPILLTVAMGGSIGVLLVYVLPKFSALFDDMGQSMPWSAAFIMGLSNALREYWWAILGGSALIAFGLYRWVNTPRGRYQWDSIKLKLVGIGPVLRKMEVASLARTFGTLIKSGVPVMQGLGIVREVAGNQVISRALIDVETGVREGEGVANPLARSGVFPPLAVQMISVGEETGRLDEMLLRVAEHYDRDVRTAINQFTRLLEPVLILVMGVVVGFIVVSMLSAIFTVNDLPL
jgi:general secretion pathway protein F